MINLVALFDAYENAAGTYWTAFGKWVASEANEAPANLDVLYAEMDAAETAMRAAMATRSGYSVVTSTASTAGTITMSVPL